MPWVNVGTDEEFTESMSRIVEPRKDLRIGVFKSDGKYYAYEDICVHQGGPACEGDLFSDVEWEKVSSPPAATENNGDGSSEGIREFPSKENFNFACPWHGVEYDIKTGISRVSKKMKLRSYKVVEKNGIVKILI
jgi:nitrite reductase/ring-hydroxylating ferredoxin subunit